jgi:hypothetical protein
MSVENSSSNQKKRKLTFSADDDVSQEPEVKTQQTAVLEAEGDILLYEKADYIVQQCNCLTVRGHGLSASITEKFPEADPYAKRRPMGARNLAVVDDRPEPGTIDVFGRIVCLYGQWRPGRFGTTYFYRYPESPEGVESPNLRIEWFRRGLVALVDRIGSDKKATIAFPDHIGCGLAGGNWTLYRAVIEWFAMSYPNLSIVIVKQ